MADRHLHGWRSARDERAGSWALFPRPMSALGAPMVDVWRYRPPAPFPQPSAGRPVTLHSASPAPTALTPPPQTESSAEWEGDPVREAETPPAPEARTAPVPRVIPLGGDLALVSVGRWDEESATTIQMPAVRPGPEPDSSPGSGDQAD